MLNWWPKRSGHGHTQPRPRPSQLSLIVWRWVAATGLDPASGPAQIATAERPRLSKPEDSLETPLYTTPPNTACDDIGRPGRLAASRSTKSRDDLCSPGRACASTQPTHSRRSTDMAAPRQRGKQSTRRTLNQVSLVIIGVCAIIIISVLAGFTAPPRHLAGQSYAHCRQCLRVSESRRDPGKKASHSRATARPSPPSPQPPRQPLQRPPRQQAQRPVAIP